MKIGVPREIHEGERRVATTPDVAGQLQKLGYNVVVEKDAGATASYSDSAFREAGCDIADSSADIWSDADIILKVRGPSDEEAAKLKASQTLISFLYPGQNPERWRDRMHRLCSGGSSWTRRCRTPRRQG